MLNEAMLAAREGFQAPAITTKASHAANSHFQGIKFSGTSRTYIFIGDGILYKTGSFGLSVEDKPMQSSKMPTRFEATVLISAAGFIVAIIALALTFIPSIAEAAKIVASGSLAIGCLVGAKASEMAHGILQQKD